MAGAPRRPRVALVSDNGHGLGHLTRLLAIARRLPAELDPTFLTLSAAHRTVADHGYAVEYFPSASRLGVRQYLWTELFRERLVSFVARLQPAVLVIDHVSPPYEAIEAVREHQPSVVLVWSRRGLWRPNRNQPALKTAPLFHRVIEPLDLAAPIDQGLTGRWHTGVEHVRPITLLEDDELLPRAEARSALGLDPDRACVLVHLNADSETQLHGMILTVADLVRDLGSAQVFAPKHALRLSSATSAENVVMHPVYPLGRYLRAFDAAVAASGYNSFHELMAAGIPTVFVPRQTNSLDDQPRRARYASMVGAGWFASGVEDAALAQGLQQSMDTRMAQRARGAMQAIHPGNGAQDAAGIVERLAVQGYSRTPSAPDAVPS